MITIMPLTEVTLGHRAYLVAVAESGHVAAVSREGAGTLLAPDHITCTPFRLTAEVSDVALSAIGSLVAVIARGRLTLISTDTLRPVHRSDESFESSCFSPAGALWSVAWWDEDSVAVEIREPETWKVVARTELHDPFGDSRFKILPHPDGKHVALWAYGHDGQSLFWAHRHGSEIAVNRVDGMEATAQPSFTQSGDRLLAICDSNELRHYGFPMGPLYGKMRWPFDDTDNQIGDIVSFVDSSRALLSSTAERLYLVDLRKMSIAGEVGLRGHEPKPVAEVYPSRRKDSGLCSDLWYFTALPTGGFLSVHRKLPWRPESISYDSILTWDIPPSGESV
jgi:hypothetical protein